MSFVSLPTIDIALTNLGSGSPTTQSIASSVTSFAIPVNDIAISENEPGFSYPISKYSSNGGISLLCNHFASWKYPLTCLSNCKKMRES